MLALRYFGMLLILYAVTRFTDAQCSQDADGTLRFGQNCGYVCNCLDTSEQCDHTNGECSSGCDWNWGGPGCQYKNIVLKSQLSRQLDNTDPPNYSVLAYDEDLTTCSETGKETTARTIEPWWKVWFPQNETIRELSILTGNKSLGYFRSFRVTVEYVPESENVNREYYPTSPQTCFTFPNSVPTSTTVSVICTRLLVGNQVRIQLGSTDTQLVLCDVRVFGDCPDHVCRLNCSEVCHCNSPTFEDKLSGICSLGCQDRWTGEGGRCDIECAPDKWGQTCQNDCGKCDNMEPCVVSSGLCLNGCNAGYQPPKCIDECADGRYGKDCTLICSYNCLEDAVCRKTDGVCPNGCKLGYKGDTCVDQCADGRYGKDCMLNCSNNCLEDAVCRKTDGVCPNGCKPGYIGDTCVDQCADGRYGKDCTQKCTNNCLEGEVCRKEDGICTNGCKPGYTGNTCVYPCEAGKYGKDCNYDCHRNCLEICAASDGQCTCKPGWKGPNCSTECDYGEWGIDCRRQCGKCANRSTCNRFDGVCDNGCMPGYSQTAMCDVALLDGDGKQDSVTGAAVGGSVSGIVGIVVGVAVTFYVMRRRQRGKTETRSAAYVNEMVDKSTHSCREFAPKENPYEESSIESNRNDDEHTYQQIQSVL